MGAAAKQVPRVFARAFSPRESNKIIYDSTIRDILSATRSSLLEKVLLRARVIANPHFLQLPNVGNPHLSHLRSNESVSHVSAMPHKRLKTIYNPPVIQLFNFLVIVP